MKKYGLNGGGGGGGGGGQEKILRLHLGSLFKQLVCATRYAINVGTKPTKSLVSNKESK